MGKLRAEVPKQPLLESKTGVIYLFKRERDQILQRRASESTFDVRLGEGDKSDCLRVDSSS